MPKSNASSSKSAKGKTSQARKKELGNNGNDGRKKTFCLRKGVFAWQGRTRATKELKAFKDPTRCCSRARIKELARNRQVEAQQQIQKLRSSKILQNDERKNERMPDQPAVAALKGSIKQSQSGRGKGGLAKFKKFSACQQLNSRHSCFRKGVCVWQAKMKAKTPPQVRKSAMKVHLDCRERDLQRELHHAEFAPSPSAKTAKSHRAKCDDDRNFLPVGVRHQVSERQGQRAYMEDKSLYETDWHHKGWHLFGVFDGHGGSRASSYVRDEIADILRSRIVESERDRPAGVKEITEAFSSSFNEIERRFLDIARPDQLTDGTTALLGLLRNNTLHTGWVGDSRCILSRQGRYVRVSEDHKPDKPNERNGVEARGGLVLRHRNGPHYVVADPTHFAPYTLAMSRAIGDIHMKEPRNLVLSEPEVKTINILPQDEFLVLASDGLFDVMDDQSVIDTVGNYLKEYKSYQGAADMLTELALEKGSRDNVTVVIIEFVWAPPLPPPQEGRTRSRHQYAVHVPGPALRKRAV